MNSTWKTFSFVSLYPNSWILKWWKSAVYFYFENTCVSWVPGELNGLSARHGGALQVMACGHVTLLLCRAPGDLAAAASSWWANPATAGKEKQEKREAERHPRDPRRRNPNEPPEESATPKWCRICANILHKFPWISVAVWVRTLFNCQSWKDAKTNFALLW